MSARPERSRAPADAAAWIVSPACRALLAGQPFTLDSGPEVRVEYRIAGRRGLLSDLLVLSPSDPRADSFPRICSISIADLENHIDAGLVSCIVDARIAFGGMTSDSVGAPRYSLSRQDQNRRADPSSFMPAGARSQFATPGAIATPALSRTHARYSPKLVADVVATAASSPGTTASAIHARLCAGWPQRNGSPPSRSTVERWVRRSRNERTSAFGGEPLFARPVRRRGIAQRWPGGGCE